MSVSSSSHSFRLYLNCGGGYELVWHAPTFATEAEGWAWVDAQGSDWDGGRLRIA